MNSDDNERDEVQPHGEVPSSVVICAWCEAVIGDVDGGASAGLVSHGICAECYAQQMESLNQ